MSDTSPKPVTQLSERSKELRCLYRIEELLSDRSRDFDRVLQEIVNCLPEAWEYTSICQARLVLEDRDYTTAIFDAPVVSVSEPIITRSGQVGLIEVSYRASGAVRHFVPEEEQLLQTIAGRIGLAVEHRELQQVVHEIDQMRGGDRPAYHQWHTIVELLVRTDQKLYARMARKLLAHMCWSGVRDASCLFGDGDVAYLQAAEETGHNAPQGTAPRPDILESSARIFEIAEQNLSERTIFTLLQKWLKEDKASFIFRTLVNLDHPLTDVADAVRRFIDLNPPDGLEITEATGKGIQVLLIRRMITNQLEYINVAKRHLTIRDFYNLIDHVIIPARSHGVIGGKAAGLFLAARILRSYSKERPLLADVATPNTWYLPSDSLHYFMNYNDMEEMFEQKYKPMEEIRGEYPHIVDLFKSSRFPPEIVHGLSMALDDLGPNPIIVRSSSRLEDRFGSAFSGKYKSLFIANQGTKQQRLAALLDAVAEVYSSLFGPDPIQYRVERGLLDVREEMGVIIQQVVGNRVGDYFLPTCAGLAFSANEFRWSARLSREDGLVRLVPGLGTRAVDRTADDYPVLIAPGQPGLRVNSTPEETAKYAPAKLDAMNLATNRFETIGVDKFLKACGEELPGVERMVSTFADGRLTQHSRLMLDFSSELVVTFGGLIDDRTFIGTIRDMLEVLETEIGAAVDIEFAYDGRRIWLLQCRPQSRSTDTEPAPIPKNIDERDLLFRTCRHVSNGLLPDISHIVYVDGRRYGLLPSAKEMRAVGNAVSRLNKILPKRRFVLIGPGRWGSRGDIRQGVSVGYADISNTAALMEVATEGAEFTPDLSFGTHFFQDLVEASIRYVPIYPGDEASTLDERFLSRAHNELADLVPEFAALDQVIRVIDVPKATGGRILRVLQNADLNEAVGLFADPTAAQPARSPRSPDHRPTAAVRSAPDDHWRWRYEMAERIAERIDAGRYGLKAMYIIGSVKNAAAGAGSDIDLLVHHAGNAKQLRELQTFLEGWSVCLDELNYQRTGYRTGGLLDVHYLTDADIESRTSYAVKIDAVTDPAEPLSLG